MAGLLFLSVFLVAATGVDVLTSFSSVLACIGNIGPGLGNVGPVDRYVLLGRLEMFTVIILFVPEFFRK